MSDGKDDPWNAALAQMALLGFQFMLDRTKRHLDKTPEERAADAASLIKDLEDEALAHRLIEELKRNQKIEENNKRMNELLTKANVMDWIKHLQK